MGPPQIQSDPRLASFQSHLASIPPKLASFVPFLASFLELLLILKDFLASFLDFQQNSQTTDSRPSAKRNVRWARWANSTLCVATTVVSP